MGLSLRRPRKWLSTISTRMQGARVGPIGFELSQEKLHLVQLERNAEGGVTLGVDTAVVLDGRV